MTALGRWIARIRTRRAISNIRSTMLSFGFDLEPFSDSDIIDATEATENFAELTIKAEPVPNARAAFVQYIRSVGAQTACYKSIDYLRESSQE